MADFKQRFKDELDSLEITRVSEVRKKLTDTEIEPVNKHGRLKLISVIAAIMCIAVLSVGASAFVKRIYVPQRGILYEYPYDIYALEEGVFFADGYIDAIMRTYDEDGKSIMTIYALFERTEDARNIPEMLVTYPDGTMIDTSDRNSGYGRRNAAGYAIYNLTDVPDSNTFTLISGEHSVDIELTEVDTETYGMTDVTEVGGAELMLYPLPGGGNTFAVYTDYVGDASLLEEFGISEPTADMFEVSWFDCTAYDPDGNKYVIGLENNDISGNADGTSINNRFVIFTRAAERKQYASREEAENAPKVPISERLVDGGIVTVEVTNLMLSCCRFDEQNESAVIAEIPNPALSDGPVALDITLYDNKYITYKLISAEYRSGEVCIEYETEQKGDAYVQLGVGVSRDIAMSQGNHIDQAGVNYITFTLNDETLETIPLCLNSLSMQYEVNSIINY